MTRRVFSALRRSVRAAVAEYRSSRPSNPDRRFMTRNRGCGDLVLLGLAIPIIAFLLWLLLLSN